MRILLIARIADKEKDQAYAGAKVDSPKSLADFHKDFMKMVKAYKATVIEQTLTSCKAVAGDLILSYGEAGDAKSLAMDYDRERWNSYLPKKNVKD